MTMESEGSSVEGDARFLVDGKVYSLIGEGEDAAGNPVIHLRGEEDDDLLEMPQSAIHNLERA
ncbi:MAG TPA: hypothetical protein VFJ66_03870 [Gaiellales bacterium]|jgi:hypothetical protein|nr:hypothetical protein [Gaiellales bacterium]